ncbi:LysR substrate-binding domain-containing protein [Pseudomonas sp. R11F]|uniref:LysR family transcriptional regulator n=1 Tax=Pseudomonas palleroniana TaxID=191390 RepID=A0A0X7JYR5_9PSED|nr:MULTISPECIES: LysR substrate-binding domain-containing protein [Pseudomonas]AVE03140.1 LysR family transcriptional regulator [Pseudomonas palleroniana]KWU48589.1 LysR family transcriptional regulator [Pseudomonas palleroniana]MBI6911326.1 LysR family transcriptional regulator [Pseudomonas palleroniana]NCE88302.1 LysR family transcriptional regulator [Pseudomonas sp. Q1]UOK36794.1 LysR substrate-binding domain-containing protein [Pseudomonas palleroniana]
MSMNHDALDQGARRLPPLYALRAFELAARFSSFTQAADTLFITQSAVSRHVKALEEHFGCALFERKGPKIFLTQTGRLLAQELKVGFRLIENACTVTSRKEKTLRVKAPSTLTMRWLLHVLDEFNAVNGIEQAQLSSEWMDVDFVNFDVEPFDCAVLLGNGRFSDDLEFIKLFDEWLIPVCSPSLLEQHNLSGEGIFSAELIHPSRDRRDWQRWLERVGLMSAVSWQKGKIFDTLELGISAAIQGRGVSIGDLALVGDELVKGSLVLPYNKAVSTGDSYYLVWPARSNHNAALESFKRYLLETVPVIDERGLEFLS